MLLITKTSEHCQIAAEAISGMAYGFDALVKTKKYSDYVDKIVVDERKNGFVRVCWLDNQGKRISNYIGDPAQIPATMSDSRVVKDGWTEMPLCYYRHERGLTLQQLSDISGVHINVIARVERGEREFGGMSVETAYKLAKALGVSIEDLYGV